MLDLGPVAFASPWLLVALAGLPVLWWLLRITPPAPRQVRFPAIRLLFEIARREETPARTPWWLLLLRLVAAALVILALAQPVLNPAALAPGSGPVLVVIDDGWPSGPDWTQRQRAAGEIVDRAERIGRPLVLLATAPDERGAPPSLTPSLPAPEMRQRLAALRPKPWAPDRAAARAALADFNPAGSVSVYWIDDGIEHAAEGGTDHARLTDALARLGDLVVIAAPREQPVRLMLPPRAEAGQLVARLVQTPAPLATTAAVLARTADGRTLARIEVPLAAGASAAEGAIALPPELRNRLARLEIENTTGAGAVALLDERWRRRPVGLIAGAAEAADQPLIGELFYLDRALAPFAELRRGTVSSLLQRELAVMILADLDALPEPDQRQLGAWIERGGMLIRFAGPRTAARPDALLPVRLRAGDRQLGGALSWTQPAALAAFAEDSPFAGLPIPEDVRVERQVLAEPTPELARRSWARLADGTPLVTAEPRGQGFVVLFHVTANTDWSNLPLSGLFVEMLQRLLQLSQGVTAAAGDAVLPPYETLDGWGRLGSPPATAAGIAARDIATARTGPRHPPGFYGEEANRRALNLAPGLPPLRLAGALPAGTPVLPLAAGGAAESDLKPPLLALALVLLVLDLIIALGLRGLLRPGARGLAGARLALLLAALALPLAPGAARAQGAPGGGPDTMGAALEMRLGHVLTGQAQVDDAARMGLVGLSAFVNQRTAANLGPPAGVRPGRDELAVYPLLYWPVTAEQPPLDADAQRALNAFMRNGGILLLDTRDAGLGGGAVTGEGEGNLRRLTRGLSIPALIPVPADHVLARAFYLLDQFPGRWTGGTIWVQRDQDRANDSVSPVIVGGHDWAAAWAVDAQGRNPFAVVPGGARQRLLSYRFGLNLVMYALTGNYKGDQVHVPAILERLGH